MVDVLCEVAGVCTRVVSGGHEFCDLGGEVCTVSRGICKFRLEFDGVLLRVRGVVLEKLLLAFEVGARFLAVVVGVPGFCAEYFKLVAGLDFELVENFFVAGGLGVEFRTGGVKFSSCAVDGASLPIGKDGLCVEFMS